MAREVWITGIGLVSSLGEGLDAHWAALADAAQPKPVVDLDFTPPFGIHPMVPLTLDKQIPKKSDQRQMEPWQRLGTYAAGLALADAGIAGNTEILSRTHAVIAADGGERDVPTDTAILEGLVPQRAAVQRSQADAVPRAAP
jgi:3-oxoacyl-[acyl-carrier-protein] synthase II